MTRDGFWRKDGLNADFKFSHWHPSRKDICFVRLATGIKSVNIIDLRWDIKELQHWSQKNLTILKKQLG